MTYLIEKVETVSKQDRSNTDNNFINKFRFDTPRGNICTDNDDILISGNFALRQ